MLQRIGTMFLPRSQLGAIEIKGFAGTGSTGLQLTSGIRCYFNDLTISFLLCSKLYAEYYRCILLLLFAGYL